MPGLVRKILIFAAIDGLLLLPTGPRARSSNQTKIAYKSGAVNSAPSNDPTNPSATSSGSSFEAFGIAGLLSVPSGSWLIAITRRDPVAEIKGRQIFVITDIALIPLHSKSEAEAAISRLKESGSKSTSSTAVEDVETDDELDDNDAFGPNDDLSDDEEPRRPTHQRTKSSIAEDVIGKKGVYGRFAERWFSKRGWQVDQNRLQGLSGKAESVPMHRLKSDVGTEDDSNKPVSVELDAVAAESQGEKTVTGDQGLASGNPPTDLDSTTTAGNKADEENIDSVANSLTPKLLRTAKILLSSSRSFYFSYDHDITRSVLKQTSSTSSEVPLHKKVDQEFFWNRHLQAPFIEAGQHQYVLPLMQGFIAQQHFQIPSTEGTTRNFLLTLLSRRSIHRAGLRYLRRGADEDGHVANCVETEQLLYDVDKDASYSFVQMRGSIPIFFQQSPYALKPKPVVMHSVEANKAALQMHFRRVKERYGDVQAVNLVERKGNEGVVGGLYEQYAHELADPKIRFEWFDFHHECRGMKFENVSILFDRIGSVVEEFGWTEETGDKLGKKQSGVFRTNCMDCLDRTNVVMSNFGKRAIDMQLTLLGVDTTKLDESLNFMNLLWADNGDAISKQYSSTAALKGDFTRTKKRNISGALTDFGLTLNRYWNNIIGDFFTQAAIDYLLGNVSAQVFVDFESKMMTGDPAVSMSRVRQNAIETSSKLVIADSTEEMIGGWTLLAPREENTLRTFPFQETVLLLTDSAIYFCRFDFTMDKVSSFERISLQHIKGLQYGAYITSTLTSAQVDEKQNVGLMIKYEAGEDDTLRINTRSLTSNFSRSDSSLAISTEEPPRDSEQGDQSAASNKRTSPSDVGGVRLLAFKTLPADAFISQSSRLPSPIRRSNDSDEEKIIIGICSEIERACKALNQTKSLGRIPVKGDNGDLGSEVAISGETEPKAFTEKLDIVSLTEAKKSTGVLEQVGYSIRRWLYA